MEIRQPNIIKTLKPHPLAFTHLYALWIYIIILSIVFYLHHDTIESYAATIPFLGTLIKGYATLTLWAILIVVPMLIVSALKIVWKYFLLGIVIGIVLPIILWYFKQPLHPTLYYTGIAIGIIGIIGVELHRRAHRYIITDRGIIMEYRGLRTLRREILYSNITDIVLEKGILGKIFNFGNIIPITASGLGLGEDSSHVAVGAAVGKTVTVGGAVIGGRGVNVPRTRSFFMLYAVPKPEEVYNIIIEAMRASEEAPYLRKILDTLKKQQGGSESQQPPPPPPPPPK